MFSKKKQKGSRPQGRFDTLISAKTRVEGSIHFTGGLHVEGRVQGSIVADTEAGSALIRLSENGEVEGDIVAPNIIINGTVKGDVFAREHLELAPKAAITGNVYYNLIEMAAGASVNGNMVHQKDPDTLPLPEPRRGDKVAELKNRLPSDRAGESDANTSDEKHSSGRKAGE